MNSSKSIPCVVIVFYNDEIIRQTLEFLLLNNRLDITVIENPSIHTPAISDYLKALLHKGLITNYVLFDRNISNNAFEVFFDAEVIDLSRHKYLLITDGDLIVEGSNGRDWLEEEYTIIQNNTDVAGCAINISSTNLPVKTFANAYDWIPKGVEYPDFIDADTGVHLLLLRTKEFINFLNYRRRKDLKFIDGNIRGYYRNVLKKKWAVTKKHYALHLPWDLYKDLNHPYTRLKTEKSFEDTWNHDSYCGFSLYNKEGVKYFSLRELRILKKVKQLKYYCKKSVYTIFKNLRRISGLQLSQQRAKYRCSACHRNVDAFLPLPEMYFRIWKDNGFIFSVDQFETLSVDTYLCPHCSASDRDRLVALYFEKHLKCLDKRIKLIEFAPSASLTRFFKQFPNLEYRTADLFMEGVDDKVDLTNMQLYADNTFDIFICSHILEHIENDLTAMRELYRVLKPGGWGIVMVPIMLTLEENLENQPVLTETDRWKYYGQDDHVRMYAKPIFVKRLQQSGFTVKQYGKQFFGKQELFRHGINRNSILYIVEK